MFGFRKHPPRTLPAFAARERQFGQSSNYNEIVARGWESKSVEAQQDEASQRGSTDKPRLTPEQINRAREIGKLRLSLKSVLQQMANTGNSRHREMLERAAADLEMRIQKLGG